MRKICILVYYLNVISLTERKENMNTEFKEDALQKIIQHYKEDKETIEVIYDILKGFEEYHIKIYEMEIKMRLFSYDTLGREDYQYMVKELDKMRTMQHNSILSGVNILNRLAANAELESVYDDIVSEERPYRREVANAVLAYVEDVIKNRK